MVIFATLFRDIKFQVEAVEKIFCFSARSLTKVSAHQQLVFYCLQFSRRKEKEIYKERNQKSNFVTTIT